MSYLPEPNAPARLTRSHVGHRFLYKLPNQAVICSGEVTDFSDREDYVEFSGKHWMPNVKGTVLAVLTKASRRSTPV